MAGPTLLNTARGDYRLTMMEEAGLDCGALTLTLAVEHAGGLEKFGFRCRIAQALLKQAGIDEPDAIPSALARWLEGQFEQVREAALKSVRSERRLAEFEFDETRLGPFRPITQL
jgi:hypothetical protein